MFGSKPLLQIVDVLIFVHACMHMHIHTQTTIRSERPILHVGQAVTASSSLGILAISLHLGHTMKII